MRRMRFSGALLLAAVAALTAGCEGEEMGAFGLQVEVRDAVTGAPAAYEAMLVIEEGAFVDTIRGWELYAGLDPYAQLYLPALFQRPGRYDVEVVHPDYRIWSREGVEVGMSGSVSPMDGSRLVRTTRLIVALERE